MSSSPTCSACGGGSLHPHLRVAGEAGPEGLIPTTDRYGTALDDIVRCASCGHMQLQQFPPEEVLEGAYADAASEDYVGEEVGQRETARRTLALLERHTQAGRLLDLGCWVGFLLDEARQRGWTPVGVEPSHFASAFARDRLGLDVRTTNLFDAELEPHAFDGVVLGDVLEHLIDPALALEHIADLCRRGAAAAFILPDAGSRVARLMGKRWWSVIPTHVQYFTRGSLHALLSRCGWQLLELRTSPKAFSVRYYLERLHGYAPPLAVGAVRAAELAHLAERIWAPDFRDRMVAIARPPL